MLIALTDGPFIYAQQIIQLSETESIQLHLDYVRKGVQQEDAYKIISVFAAEVTIDGEKKCAQESILYRFQNLFENKSIRQFLILKPDFPRSDSRLITSDFWDFDILDPVLSFSGDTAFVDCELILWAGRSNVEGKVGRRSTERFIFVSTSRKEVVTTDLGRTGTYGNPDNSPRRLWQLIGFNNLIAFLESGQPNDEIPDSHEGDTRNEE
jgi:hypothetical protein